MKKLLLFVAFAALFSIGANAQEWIDVIYLKNGSRIKGVIIEQVPGQTYKLQTFDGGILICNAQDIEKMTREQNAEVANAYSYSKNSSSTNSSYSRSASRKSNFNKPKGYYGLIELQAAGYNFTAGNFGSFGIDMVNGYRFCPQFALGLGIGLEGAYTFRYFQLPVYLQLRSDFLNAKVSPFVAFNVGYQGVFGNGGVDGTMIKPQAGVSFNVGSKRMSVALNYKAFLYDYYDHYSGYGSRSYCEHEVGLSVGITL